MADPKLCLIGDVIPTRRFPSETGTHTAVFRTIGETSFSLGNFEISLSGRNSPIEKLLNIGASPEIADDLPQIGMQAVTLANNHSVDHGWSALSDTRDALRARGIQVCGIGEDIDDAARPITVQVEEKRIGVIAFSCLLPTGMAAGPNRPGISPIHIDTAYEIDPLYQLEEPGDPNVVKIRTRARDADVSRACDAIRTLAAQSDIVIVTVHWGFGSGDDLAEYQWPLARSFVDAGANIVHGHHPHAVHPVGFYRNCPVFFGLGTLIGQQVFLDAPAAVKVLWAEMSADSCLAFLNLNNSGEWNIELRPTVMDSDRLPAFAHAKDFERVLERLKRLSVEHGAEISGKDGTIVVRPKA